MPTLLELCDIDVPDSVDGISLVKNVLSDTQEIREYLHGEHSFHSAFSNHYIVTPQDKFIWYSETGQEQYFEKIESLHSEYKDVLTEPVVVDFLSAEQRMCKLMRLVYDGIAENIKLDLSYMDEL